ncbi:unnamed protein product [Closterium sp. Yama58-4]|nr:unnamed protein product [Closterium sp. Yama58-4]
MACVAGDSARGAADSPRTGVAVSAAMPSPTRSATAGGILRRGGLKRMPSLDSMLPAYATSSSPSSSPLSIPTAANPHATVTPTEPLPGAASTTAPPYPGLLPVGSPIPTPQLSPGRSPKGKHVRRVSFCSMVRVRRFSACDADLGPAADAAITAFAEAEAAAAAERAAAEESAESAAAAAGAASQATAKTAKAAEEVRAAKAAKAAEEVREARAAEENVQAARVPPAALHALQRNSQSFESTQKFAAQHALQWGSQSFTERPHRHSRSPSYSGSLHLVPEPAAQPRGIRRSSSFQSPGSGASAGQHSSYGRPRHQLAYLPSHYPSNHTAHLPPNLSPNYHSSQSFSAAGRSIGAEEKRGGQELPELGDVGVGSGSGEFELELRLPVPPKMPFPRLSPSPRVQRLLQQMWGDLDDGDDV